VTRTAPVVARSSPFVSIGFGMLPTMRMRRHTEKGSEHHEPAWATAKPAWTEVRIGAPKAAELVAGEPEHAPVRAA
jgi:hypothetical protein